MVSEEKLKSYTSIHESVSPKDLVPYVLQAQEIYLRNYLGGTFYNQLVEQIKNNVISAPNRLLLDDFVGPILVNYSFYHAIPFLAYKIFNKSILKPNSENAPSVELDEVKFLQTNVREVAESYVEQMQRYLAFNLGLYPAYATWNSRNGEQAPDTKKPYFSGIQTNSQFFNWKKYRNYPYGTGTSPGGAGGWGGYGVNEQPCGNCDQPLN
jgi:hypothetical protein